MKGSTAGTALLTSITSSKERRNSKIVEGFGG
jgi:hypothetical protein